jgi:SAM-dependent methyltransferase
LRGKSGLDVGCGTGEKARYFAEEGASSVIGIDASSVFAEIWAEHAKCANLELVQGSFDDLMSLPNIEGQAFDLIVSFQALMYARDLVNTIKVIANLLVDSGTFVFSVPPVSLRYPAQ